MNSIIDKWENWKLHEKIIVVILIGLVSLIVVLAFVLTPDGANPAFVSKMETKYFIVRTDSSIFRLVIDGERLWKDKMIIESCIDDFAERVFSWMTEADPFTKIKKLKVRVGKNSLRTKFELNFYGTQQEMFNKYTETTNAFVEANREYLFCPPNRGFACVYTPAVISALIIQSNVHRINASVCRDPEIINPLVKAFTEWNRTRVQ